MRTEASRSSASARVRRGVARARTWMGGRGRSARLAAVVAAVAALAGVASLAIPLDRDELLWLYDGRDFSPGAALAIQKALAAERIAFKPEGSRIGVAPSRWSDAMAAMTKHGVEPPSLEEIEKDRRTAGSWLEGPDDRADRQQWLLERKLEAMIGRYDGVRSADVTINRTAARSGPRSPRVVSGLVVLDAERQPPHRVIQSIQTLLSKAVPDLAPEAVSVTDQSGHFYLKAGDPAAASVTRSRAREEELRDRLVEQLAPLIQGVDVVVRVGPPGPAEAAPLPPRPAATVPSAPDEGVRPNAPIGLDPDPSPAPARPMPTPVAAPSVGKADVWVKVPRSHYARVSRENAPNRSPSQEDLKFYHQKTRDMVDHAVRVLFPPAEQGQVMVDIVRDDRVADAPLIVPAGSADAGRSWSAWAAPLALGAGIGLGAAVALGTGVGLIAARRPSSRPSRTSVRSGLSVDAPSGPVPGPSERVRDLVRRDPEAAAGVLQRWIGQGEGGPG